MNILLTNDDGYDAEGILTAKRLLSKYGRVFIVAPKEHMSAKSCSITIGIPLHLVKVEEDVYYVDGTPADCVALAMSELHETIDLLVSGCNSGLNVSYDTIYSGTIGACLEGISYGLKAIALSCPTNDFYGLETGFEMMWEFINKNNLISNEYILNINFPKEGGIQGISLAREYYRNDTNYFTLGEEGYYAYRYMDKLKDIPEDTDCYMVKHGIISVCPIQKTYYSESLFNKIKNNLK